MEAKARHPVRTVLILSGVTIVLACGGYLAAGLLGLVPLERELIAWNNIRIVSGIAIFGCLMAAVGYGNE